VPQRLQLLWLHLKSAMQALALRTPGPLLVRPRLPVLRLVGVHPQPANDRVRTHTHSAAAPDMLSDTVGNAARTPTPAANRFETAAQAAQALLPIPQVPVASRSPDATLHLRLVYEARLVSHSARLTRCTAKNCC